MKAAIRSYDASVDSDAAFELWGRSIGRSWPVEREDFDAIVHEGFVASSTIRSRAWSHSHA